MIKLKKNQSCKTIFIRKKAKYLKEFNSEKNGPLQKKNRNRK